VLGVIGHRCAPLNSTLLLSDRFLPN
jgi:pentatricopeptide repeat protein